MQNSANIPNLSFQCDAAFSRALHGPYRMPGTRLRIETPPESRYRKGIIGSIVSISSSGNLISSNLRSLTNTIHGRAPLAPDRGPVEGMSQDSDCGWKGS